MQKTFSTPAPTRLYVEVGAGAVTVHAKDDIDETSVTVDGSDADHVIVEQRDDKVVVLAPHRRGGLFSGSGELYVTVAVPSDSELVTKLGSAELVATGRYGAARIKSGSATSGSRTSARRPWSKPGPVTWRSRPRTATSGSSPDPATSTSNDSGTAR